MLQESVNASKLNESGSSTISPPPSTTTATSITATPSTPHPTTSIAATPSTPPPPSITATPSTPGVHPPTTPISGSSAPTLFSYYYKDFC